MKTTTRTLLIMATATAIFTSCKKDKENIPEPQKPAENELITTMKLVMTDSENSSNISTAIFKDPDGDGGLPISKFDTIRLNSSKTYNVKIFLLNESKTPTDTISNEVAKEADQHQFFYSVVGANVTFAYADKDKNNVPVGMETKFITGTASVNKNGELKVVLKHQPDEKPKSGNGDINKGSTDIEVYFPIIIK